jgi:hypothetical protein
MELKIQDALMIVEVINKLTPAPPAEPVKPASYEMTACRRMLRNQRAIVTELKEFQDARNAIVKDCQMVNDDGDPVAGDLPGTVKLDPAKMAEFNAAMNSLLDDTITVELQDVDPEKLPPIFNCADLTVLEPLFKE